MNYFSDITNNIYFKIFLLITGAIVLFLVYRYIKNLVLFGAGDETTTDAANNINTNDLSFTHAEFLAKAATMERGAQGNFIFSWGTDEDSMLSVLQSLQSSSDFYKLVQVYGVRNEMNMIEMMFNELDDAEIDNVRSILAMINVNI